MTTTLQDILSETADTIEYLYVLEQDLSPLGFDRKLYKIGITNSLKRRLQNLQTGAAVPITVYALLTVGDREETCKVEKFLHNKFLSKIAPAGNEWFLLEEEDLEYILSLKEGE